MKNLSLNLSKMYNILFLLLAIGSCCALPAFDDDNVVNIVDSNDDLPPDLDTIDLSGYGDALYGEPSNNTGKLVDDWDSDSEMNPEEVGEYLEGDILVPRDSKVRNGIVGEYTRWPKGVIPFDIKGRFSKFIIQINLFYNEFNNGDIIFKMHSRWI